MTAAFGSIVRFELRASLSRVSTWVYFGIFFALSFLIVNAVGGAWESVGGSGSNVHVNSPYVLAVLSSLMSLCGVMVTAALLGNAVYRDYETGIAPFFFTTPISKAAYLGGRFTGALLVNAFVLLSIPLGLILASAMPYLDRSRFGVFQPMAFFNPYLVFILPNLIFTGAIFFSLAALTRQMMANYLGSAILFVGYLLANVLARDIQSERLAVFLDPFGLNALRYFAKYWTPAERSFRFLGLTGDLLYNRLLWVAIGVAVFSAAYSRFRFAHSAPERRRWRARPDRSDAREMSTGAAQPRVDRPAAVSLSFSLRGHLAQYRSLTLASFRSMVANRYFFAILGSGLLFLIVSASQVGKIYGTKTWPVTYQVLEALGGNFGIFILIVITFYGGDLVWRERDARTNQVQDAMPVPDWVPFSAKFTALTLMVIVLQVGILVAGVLIQAFKGYTRFELDLYLEWLFGIQLIDYVLMVALVLLIQVLANHKYLGHVIVLLYFVFSSFMGKLGLGHNLYRYASDAGMTYSDMNRFGPYLVPFCWFKAYWAAWAILFALVSQLFWVRGEESGATGRVRLARRRLGRPQLALGVGALTLIAALGGFIFYNTNIRNDYRTKNDAERATAEFERLYKKYENLPQPRIAGVQVNVDLFPAQQDVSIRGQYRLVNRAAAPIKTLHLRIPREADIRRVEFSVPATRTLADAEHGYYIYALGAALQPGAATTLRFSLDYPSRGFQNEVTDTEVVANGTFVSSAVMPALGYDPGNELLEDSVRRKFGLPPKEGMASLDDEKARRNNCVSIDADWVDFEATVSTSADQIALAPGYLQREWAEGNRRYFHYKMDAPILNFYAFLSARYAVRRDRWEGPAGERVAIEIYYHPGHEYNLERMTESVKKSLSYFTASFGPYQYRQIRILEFPRYRAYAQSLPNTIPYSEGIGFIACVKKPEDVDYPFYVTAHEVAHQWWGHQVIGANVQGARVLMESLAQYSALLVLEHEYGAGQMKKFLRYELDRYLIGRASERRKELPLLRVEDQSYIYYNKGSLAMYALRDCVGEAKINAALARFVAAKKFQQPPYTTSRELLSCLRSATPESLQSVFDDLFEHIILYDNRAASVRYAPTEDGKYAVTMTLTAKKLRADERGNESEIAMNDLIDVGVFAAPARGGNGEGKPLYFAKRRITSGTHRIKVVVDQKPARAGIDPYNKLIDRVIRDNTVGAVPYR